MLSREISVRRSVHLHDTVNGHTISKCIPNHRGLLATASAGSLK